MGLQAENLSSRLHVYLKVDACICSVGKRVGGGKAPLFPLHPPQKRLIRMGYTSHF